MEKNRTLTDKIVNRNAEPRDDYLEIVDVKEAVKKLRAILIQPIMCIDESVTVLVDRDLKKIFGDKLT